jgi:hypothetical protein
VAPFGGECRYRDHQYHYQECPRYPRLDDVRGRRDANEHGFNYRVYGMGFARSPAFHPEGRNFDDWRLGQAGFRTHWDRGPRDTLTFQGDIYRETSGETTMARASRSSAGMRRASNRVANRRTTRHRLRSRLDQTSVYEPVVEFGQIHATPRVCDYRGWPGPCGLLGDSLETHPESPHTGRVCDPSANRVGSTCAHVISGSAASFPLLATAARAGVVATNFGRRGRRRLPFHGTATQPPEQSLPLGKQRI